jgi:hypothetical protein
MNSPIASIDKIAEDTYHINIGMPDMIPGGFSFNQYLVVDEMPLLFHTGPKKQFPLVREQIETVLPLSSLRGRRSCIWRCSPGIEGSGKYYRKTLIEANNEV